jgi:ureidoacrylate peracid hydrolase
VNDAELPNDGSSRRTYRPGGDGALVFPRGKTALLVIDPVNDFLSEGGAAYPMTRATLKLHDVIEHLKLAIEGARARGIPVLFGPMAFTEEDYADDQLHRKSGINRFMFEQKMFIAGSWGADFHPELTPIAGDIVLRPHKSVDVLETDLPQHLERLGITHLVIAGMTANLCCESTGRHAMERGYDVTFLSDAIGSTNVPSYEAAVHINYPMIANGVLKVDEFLAALDESAAAAPAVHEGDTVVGSDHGEIGSVTAVEAASGGTLAHLVVRRGTMKGSVYVPLDAVVRRAGSTVFINVPKMVVGKMPWKEPPTAEEHDQKTGPSEASVTSLYGAHSPSPSP